MKYTINDISKISGYAKSTVSAAMNDQPGVGAEAKQKILNIAKELKFTPNELARSISSKSYKTVGVIVRDITNPFYAKVCRAIETYAEQYGYTTLIYNTDGKAQKINNALKMMMGKRVAGVILDIGSADSFIDEFLREKILPSIVFGLYSDYADSVESDDEMGAKEVAEYLIDCGHRDIVYIGPENSVYSERRKNGIEKTLNESKIDLKTILYKERQANISSGYDTIKDNIDSLPFSVIVCYNDLTAVGVMRALSERGINIPNDISIISFDDIDTIVFPLTTVNIPEYEMGKNAMKLLKERLENENSKLKHVMLPTKLIIRGSVKKIN